MLHTTVTEPASRRIFVFNGASSAGKTSLCKAIINLSPIPATLVSVDDYLSSHGFNGVPLMNALQQAGESFLIGFYREIAKASRRTPLVLVDHVLGDEPPACSHLSALRTSDTQLSLIGVYCDKEELLRREAARTDRRPDPTHTLRQYETIHRGFCYDATPNTTDTSPAETAKLLITKLLHLCPQS